MSSEGGIQPTKDQAEALKSVCPRCDLGDFGRKKRLDRVAHRATTPKPTVDTLIEWEFDGVSEATDGCRVEPDGHCEHGHSSWMLAFGVI